MTDDKLRRLREFVRSRPIGDYRILDVLAEIDRLLAEPASEDQAMRGLLNWCISEEKRCKDPPASPRLRAGWRGGRIAVRAVIQEIHRRWGLGPSPWVDPTEGLPAEPQHGGPPMTLRECAEPAMSRHPDVEDAAKDLRAVLPFVTFDDLIAALLSLQANTRARIAKAIANPVSAPEPASELEQPITEHDVQDGEDQVRRGTSDCDVRCHLENTVRDLARLLAEKQP